MGHPPRDFPADLRLGPARMFVRDHGLDHLAGKPPEFIDHRESLGLGLASKQIGHLIVEDLDVANSPVHSSPLGRLSVMASSKNISEGPAVEHNLLPPP